MFFYSYSRQGGVLAQYDVEDNTDVIFLCGEEPDLQRIPAHSWVLVDKSPVFRAMFKGPLTLYSSLPSFCQTTIPLACTSTRLQTLSGYYNYYIISSDVSKPKILKSQVELFSPSKIFFPPSL